MNIVPSKQPTLIELFNNICDFGGRLAGTNSERNAMIFARKSLANLPFGRLSTHRFCYDGWSNEEAWIELNGRRLEVVALPCGSSLTNFTQELEIVDAGRGTAEDFERVRAQLPGRAVVVTHEYMFDPDHFHRSRKVELALALGAAAFVIANPYDDSGMVSGGVTPAMPAFGVSKTTGELLRLAALNNGSALFHLKNRKSRRETETLDWELAPDSKQPLQQSEVIVCAHIDGHANAESALDNASGVAVALAIARDAAAFPGRDYIVRVLIFSAEEFGLCGSQNYVDGLSQEHKDRIKVVLNLDCVAGSLDFGAMTSGFESLEPLVSKAADSCNTSVRIYNQLTKNSDHYNFAVAGVPALRLIAGFGEPESKLRYVLSDSDTRDLVTGPELNRALALTTALAQLAGGSHELPHR